MAVDLNWKATISLASMLLLPVVLVAMVWVLKSTPAPLPVESDAFVQEAPWLGPGGHELIPSLHKATIVAPDRPHDPIESRTPEQLAQVSRRRSFTVSTNSLGLRGPELKVKEGFRILCLGESVTFGWGVTQAESYPSQLAQQLGVEVINAGIPAMRPHHMARWLQRHAPTINADLILFTVRPNWTHPRPWEDYFQSIRSAQRIVQPTPIAVILPPISTFDLRGNEQRPEELQQLRQHLTDIPWLDLTPAFRAALPQSGVTLSVEQGMQRVLDGRDGSVIIEARTQQPGALAPEIVSALESDHQLVEPLMFDGAHPDAAGFVVFAQSVARFIQEQGWR